ncbi:MAG: hypothetical protein FWD18_06975 [Micrococcales bacterium]|nr:hypothetical protein [Micrococcales bacterium]
MSRIGKKTAAAAAGIVMIAGLVAGCGDDADSPATPTAAAVLNLPTDCRTLGSATTRAETVDRVELIDLRGDEWEDYGEHLRPAPEGATLVLRCDWFAGDVTGMDLRISTATPDAVTAAVRGLSSQGYTCEPSRDFAGTLCEQPGEVSYEEYRASALELVAARDGVWVYMSTSNMDGRDDGRGIRALLSEIVNDIFG